MLSTLCCTHYCCRCAAGSINLKMSQFAGTATQRPLLDISYT